MKQAASIVILCLDVYDSCNQFCNKKKKKKYVQKSKRRTLENSRHVDELSENGVSRIHAGCVIVQDPLSLLSYIIRNISRVEGI